MNSIQVLVTIVPSFNDEEITAIAPGDPLEARLRNSVVEAIKNAVSQAEENGFTHDLEDLVSLTVDKVEAAGSVG